MDKTNLQHQKYMVRDQNSGCKSKRRTETERSDSSCHKPSHDITITFIILCAWPHMILDCALFSAITPHDCMFYISVV